MDFLDTWWQDYESTPSRRASDSPKLEAYYARKNIHVMKVAMAIHFGESTEMTIPTSTFQRAIDVLAEEEKTMALALMMHSNNPLAKASKKITDYLAVFGKRNFTELLTEFWEDIRKSELEEILNYLQQVDKVETVQEQDKHSGETYVYYKLKGNDQ